MSIWIDDSELFLCKPHLPTLPNTVNNAPAEIWRCKNMTASVPLKAADFTPETRVASYWDLVGVNSSWNEQNYKLLLAYITENHFLVNCKGEVFVENFPFGSTLIIDLTKKVYLRVFDSINMGKYGFPLGLPPKAIPKLPLRTVMYLDSNPVKDAEMGP